MQNIFSKILKLSIWLILLSGAMLPSLAKSLTNIDSGEYLDGELVLHYTGERPKLKTFKLKPFDGNPPRFVIDLLGSQINPRGFKNNAVGLPYKYRIAQFDEKTVRVVLSLKTEKELTGYKVTKNIDGKIYINPELGKGENGKYKRRFPRQTASKKLLPDQPKVLKSSEYLTLTKINDSKVTLRIKAKKSAQIHYQIMELNKPKRVVIDLLNWETSPETMGLKGFESNIVKSIRTGRPKPKATRIVLDLSDSKAKYAHKLNNSKELLITLYTKSHATANDKTHTDYSQFSITLDAGHGGFDSGATHGGHDEKDIVLKITDLVKHKLESRGIEVNLTRTNDKFISLDERVQQTLKAKPDAFISIHCNALASHHGVHGVETYYYTAVSKNLAFILHKALISKTGAADRRVRQARFVVIRKTQIPSVLLETGFLTNAGERRKLSSKGYQNKVAEGITQGILQYLDSK